jgi:16S rRNA (cytosine967-C5)-methyltransferase
VALRVIRRVTEDAAYSNLTLAGELERSRLSTRDRAMATDLAYGTLRRLLIIDRALGAASTRPVDQIDPPALGILRLGAYQLMFTRVPPHAAVGETVELAGDRHRSFVNAVLRAMAAAPPLPPDGRDDQAISRRTGLSPWAVGELRRLLPDEVEQAAGALASPASLAIRANSCLTDRHRLVALLEDAGHRAVAGGHHPDVIKVSAGSPDALPGYRQGLFAVQDEASVLVAAALGAAPGDRILDACAGPGGKAAHLACLAGPGKVVAADVSVVRARLARESARRLRESPLVVAQDARRPAVREGFDAALVDAPCSGLGAARRRPELLWRARREDLARLARLQVSILVGTATLIRPGGRLVYSVCTYPRAETEAAVRAFLAKRPDFEPLAVPGPEGPATSHRLWPHRHGTDAMFYAGFRRRSP